MMRMNEPNEYEASFYWAESYNPPKYDDTITFKGIGEHHISTLYNPETYTLDAFWRVLVTEAKKHPPVEQGWVAGLVPVIPWLELNNSLMDGQHSNIKKLDALSLSYVYNILKRAIFVASPFETTIEIYFCESEDKCVAWILSKTDNQAAAPQV